MKTDNHNQFPYKTMNRAAGLIVFAVILILALVAFKIVSEIREEEAPINEKLHIHDQD